jgi:hypothetical protein
MLTDVLEMRTASIMTMTLIVLMMGGSTHL